MDGLDVSDSRTVLLGMNNPLHDDARYALYPYPPRCTGARIYAMVRAGVERAGEAPPTRADYLRAFDRRNVLHARAWSAAAAKAAAPALLAALTGRRVVVLGVGTLAALGLPRAKYGAWRAYPPLTALSLSLDYTLLPHPSGLCRDYDNPETLALAEDLLARQYARWRRAESSAPELAHRLEITDDDVDSDRMLLALRS